MKIKVPNNKKITVKMNYSNIVIFENKCLELKLFRNLNILKINSLKLKSQNIN